ncbi:MAG: leucine--tRNA ligase [Phycisphaerae bacterium]|nr:MAG: leucine--tRNA ligase [Planctomycetota bacterium]MCK6464179.1 leucine--tRNA ligase [Phycisphaerae bacterium]MCQ3919692.1 leucine--tRNA ligase [Planctomycetota bacterium]
MTEAAAHTQKRERTGGYDPGEIEPRWQAWWAARGVYRAPNPGEPEFDPTRPKFYVLDMFPYPSGAGLHVGHPEGYTATDIVARYKRARGFNVLHPMGWDAFGLPAEQYAIQTGVHPAITTRKAIDTFRRQLQRFGFCYDWSREFATIDPDYYRWTQWIFLKLYNSWFDAGDRQQAAGNRQQEEVRRREETKAQRNEGQGAQTFGGAEGKGRARSIEELVAEFVSRQREPRINPDAAEHSATDKGQVFGPWSTLDRATKRRIIDSYRLAYLAEQTVNWCPKLGTALANEEVTADGLSERGHFPVFRKPLKQWMLRITAYADRLLDGLNVVDWPESTRIQQTEWIGRSEGAEIEFPLCMSVLGGASGGASDSASGTACLREAVTVPVRDTESASRRQVVPGRAAPEAGSGVAAEVLRVFTTRPDTIFGATYMVVAPEHPLVARVLEHPEPETDIEKLRAYVEAARNRGDVERMAGAEKTKTGVFTGVYCLNPAVAADSGVAEGSTEPVFAAHRARIPVWTADYVLMGYGTGAIMAVPGQDQRDWDFARTFGLPIIRTVQPPEGFDGEAYVGDGSAINSGFLNGLEIDDAKQRIIDWLEEKGIGRRRVQYKLRDWLFSRQRYWGEPFPIVFDEAGNHYPVEEGHLPVTLPEMADYHPEESDDPRPLLAKASGWARMTAGAAGVRAATDEGDVLGLPPDAPVSRETNTMPGWAGSCWYYLRYCDPKNPACFSGPEAHQYWMGKGGVDLYIGGAEHAVLHLLYARFWHKVLFDLGYVGTIEPFRKLFHQGLITSYAYQRPDKSLVAVDAVDEVEEGKFIERETGRPVAQVVAKMSKSLKNVVNPDDVIAEYGADTFRMYEMFMGPLEASKPWNTRDVGGLFKLCNRIWRLFIDPDSGAIAAAVTADAPTRGALRILHKTIKLVGEDIEHLKFNTAIARLFDFVNALTPMDRRPIAVLEPFLRVLAPFAPHLAEELRHRLCAAGLIPGAPAESVSITQLPWPEHDEALTKDDEVEIAVQILGKVKAKIVVPADADEATLERVALADAKVREQLAGRTVRKVIAVKGRLVNIVAG